jgi:hypothetical protein
LDPQGVFDRDWEALNMPAMPANGFAEGTPDVGGHIVEG